jgi:hypothetical protein
MSHESANTAPHDTAAGGPNVLDLKHPQPAAPLPLVPTVTAESNDPIGVVPAKFDWGVLSEPVPIQWEARHVLSEQGRYRHYLVLAGFALVGGVVSWWQTNWFTFLTVLIGLVAWELHERYGRPVRVRVDSAGISIDDQHFPHAELSSFDVHRMADHTVELSLATRRWHSAYLRIPLGEQDPQEVRETLLHFVQEERHGVSPLDWFVKRD